jgi:hypothetical protein
VIGPVDVACTALRKLPLTFTFLVELPGIEPGALPRLLASKQTFRSVSFRFVPVKDLRFRSGVLTASRAVSY